MKINNNISYKSNDSREINLVFNILSVELPAPKYDAAVNCKFVAKLIHH